MNKIGELIIKYRKENNLTQKELADKLGVSNTAVSKWECGNNLPDITMLKPLSQILNVSVLTLLDMPEEVVLEQNNHHDFKNKIIILVCLFFAFISMMISVMVCIYSKKKSDDVSEEIGFYTIYSDDEYFNLDGYVVVKGDRVTTIINNIFYNDPNLGTKKEIKADNIKISLLANDSILYSFDDKLEDKKPIGINEFIESVIYLKFNIQNTKIDFNLEESVFIFRIKYYINDKDIGELAFSVYLKPYFEE